MREGLLAHGQRPQFAAHDLTHWVRGIGSAWAISWLRPLASISASNLKALSALHRSCRFRQRVLGSKACFAVFGEIDLAACPSQLVECSGTYRWLSSPGLYPSEDAPDV